MLLPVAHRPLKDLIVNKGALPLGVGLRIAKQMRHGLEAIVLKCLEKDPARRFASAGELLKALSEVSEMSEGAAA